MCSHNNVEGCQNALKKILHYVSFKDLDIKLYFANVFELFLNHSGMVLALSKGPEPSKKTCKIFLKNCFYFILNFGRFS